MCGDHFTEYADIELLCRTLETGIMMDVDCTLHISVMGNKVICRKWRGSIGVLKVLEKVYNNCYFGKRANCEHMVEF